MALPGVTIIEGSVIGALHAALVVRIVRARVAAAKQRGVELERYRQLRLGERNRQQQRPLGPQ
jgi:hypothetical protein